MEIDLLKSLFKSFKEASLKGRYIHNGILSELLKDHDSKFKIETLGKSVQERDICSIHIGEGSKKILIWSQMHGNESTTTKAIFDLLNVLGSSHKVSKSIKANCKIQIIPILNPDGAFAYTRVNANNVDLNRDAQDLSQPESQVLRQLFNDFKPDFCFNLHGQRTIFGAGSSGKSASISFLSPAADKDCSITPSRKQAMSVITAMNTLLQKQIPKQVGIYDDAFNINCVGDTFQFFGVPTILFEAGHIDNDYHREITREFIFQSLIVALGLFSETDISSGSYKDYFKIPKNEKNFFDIIIRNSTEGDIAFQYEERLSGGAIEFVPKIVKIGDLSSYYGHRNLNANGQQVVAEDNQALKLESENDFVIVNSEKIALKPKKY